MTGIVYCRNGSSVLVGRGVTVGFGRGLAVTVARIGWKGVRVADKTGDVASGSRGALLGAIVQPVRANEIRINQRFIRGFIREIITG